MNRAVKEFLANLLPEESVIYDAPLKEYTSFRTGGLAACVVSVDSQPKLASLLNFLTKTENEFIVLGNGTNMLVSDQGYQGMVIRMGPGLSRIHVVDDHIYAQAGAPLIAVARAAMEKGLTGLEFAAGIPGSVGGSVVMNAGAYGGELEQVIESVTVLNQNGEIMDLDKDTMEFGYRTSALKNRPFVVTEVAFAMKKGDREEIKARMEDYNRRRTDKQPLEYPSAGSSFKRPEGHFAGKLIMDAGLRGYSIGGAQVSEKHCGFIINKGGASSQDVASLMLLVQRQVKNRFHIFLDPEIVFLGEFSEMPERD